MKTEWAMDLLDVHVYLPFAKKYKMNDIINDTLYGKEPSLY